ncbi:MAG: hypothetical protein GTO18_21025 [Anaerolineales bacterium]|nr:hypothetical protein [Anaerolineales bacterium]
METARSEDRGLKDQWDTLFLETKDWSQEIPKHAPTTFPDDALTGSNTLVTQPSLEIILRLIDWFSNNE